MFKKLSYIFIFLAVFITVSHSIIAHHHHFEETLAESDHHDDGEDDDHDHSIFSFGQLDESFDFSKYYIGISNDLNAILFLIPVNPNLLAVIFTTGRTDFITHQEFPPPEDYFYSASHRGPPTI